MLSLTAVRVISVASFARGTLELNCRCGNWRCQSRRAFNRSGKRSRGIVLTALRDKARHNTEAKPAPDLTTD
jgi:hypothetical protein